MKNIKQISDSYLCSNCGACSSICPKKAIDFKWTSIGRLYADVNEDCINCGKCLNICPSVDKKNIHLRFQDKFVGELKSVWVGRSTDNKIFQNAQSGGVATAILSYLFDEQMIDAALTCKMTYGSIPQVNPCIVTSKQQLFETQKSCYTPVPLLTKLEELKHFKNVAVIGIPCHIQGIESLMLNSSEYSNIKYRIGLICDKTECNAIQSVIKSLTNQKIFKIVWKGKYSSESNTYNYLNAPLKVFSPDGSSMEMSNHYRLGLKDLFAPPRCWICWDKLNVFSDITLGDPWRIPNINEIEGESLVIARTNVGLKLIELMSKQNYIHVRHIEHEAPYKSQLIEYRKKQVSEYAQAFEVLSPTVNSYLLQQEQNMNTTSSTAAIMLRRFAEIENMTEQEIIQIAKNELVRFENDKKRQKTFFNRLKTLIKKTVFKTFIDSVRE